MRERARESERVRDSERENERESKIMLGVQHTSRPFFMHVEGVCPDAHHQLVFGSSELP